MRKLRLGLYDSLDHDAPVRFFGGVFRDTPLERRIIRRTMKKYNRWAARNRDVLLTLGVFEVTPRGKAVSQ